MKCYNCEKFGYYAFECKAPSRNRVEEKANHREESRKKGDTLFMDCLGKERSEDNR